jgi:hypothetical protein
MRMRAGASETRTEYVDGIEPTSREAKEDTEKPDSGDHLQRYMDSLKELNTSVAIPLEHCSCPRRYTKGKGVRCSLQLELTATSDDVRIIMVHETSHIQIYVYNIIVVYRSVLFMSGAATKGKGVSCSYTETVLAHTDIVAVQGSSCHNMTTLQRYMDLAEGTEHSCRWQPSGALFMSGAATQGQRRVRCSLQLNYSTSDDVVPNNNGARNASRTYRYIYNIL